MCSSLRLDNVVVHQLLVFSLDDGCIVELWSSMSSAIIMSQSRESILPPRPIPTIVGDLMPVTVLVPTVKPFCDQDLPVRDVGLNFAPGPHISSISNSLLSSWSSTEPIAFFAISSLPPTHKIRILGFLQISHTAKCINKSVLPCLGGDNIMCCPPLSIASIICSIHCL